MYRTVFILALSCVMLSGCSTSKEEMLPAGDNTMLELWNCGTGQMAAVLPASQRWPVTRCGDR